MNIGHLIKNKLILLKYSIKDQIQPSSLLKSNIRFSKLHEGERCFILGSGPSIMRQDLKKLKGEVVFTQNHFHSHPDIGVIRPKYHCVVQFYQGEKFKEDWITWFRSMEERLPQETQFFFHLDTKKVVEESRCFPGRVNYIQAFLDPVVMNRAKVDITKTVMVVPTVITQCLTIALYMGFKKIYLLGFDMDQVCHMGLRTQTRFYQDSPITRNEYEKKNDEEHEATGFIWYHYWTMWKQFILLREEAGRRGTEIINLTDGGLLNCFTRQSYKEVIP